MDELREAEARLETMKLKVAKLKEKEAQNRLESAETKKGQDDIGMLL